MDAGMCRRRSNQAMADDKSKTGWQDDVKINLSQPYEVRDWAKKFGCTEAQLRAAVQVVGNGARKVGEYLRTKK